MMNGKRAGKAAIIIVNYKGARDTLDCLESVFKIDYPDYFVIVCDNDSRDGSSEKFREWSKASHIDGARLRIVDTGSNLGFAGGNNVAIRLAFEAGAEYFVLLNNDTTVEKDFLSELVRAAEANPEAGLVGGKIYYHCEPRKIWAAGGGFLNPVTAVSRHYCLDEADHSGNSEMKVLDYITGCLLLIKRAVIESVGLLDEKYFLYFEESDYAYRARRKGFQALYAPNSRIYHKVSASAGADSPATKYYFVRNRIYFIKRNFSFLPKIFGIAAACVQTLLRIAYHILRARPDKSAVLFRGLIDGLFGNMGVYRS